MPAIPTRYLRLLLLVPIATYAVSYLYLANYHGEWWLWNTVVHEGGTHTLLWTTLYASHFLGHVPSLTVIAMMFAGFGMALLSPPLSPPSKLGGGPDAWRLVMGIVVLLIVSVIISGFHFGWGETWEFILQQRQSVERLESGGSWMLHLPSTMMMFVFVPLFIAIAAWVFGKGVALSRAGRNLLLLSGALAIVITIIVAGNPLHVFAHVFTNPRYLAHAAREVVTFPLIFFPIPMYYYIRQFDGSANISRDAKRFLTICAMIFALVFGYMVMIPLQHGIGDLAQAPSFAHGGRLSILYLIASHFFEHFLDTVYFGLLCALLVNGSRARGDTKGEFANT